MVPIFQNEMEEMGKFKVKYKIRCCNCAYKQQQVTFRQPKDWACLQDGKEEEGGEEQ